MTQVTLDLPDDIAIQAKTLPNLSVVVTHAVQEQNELEAWRKRRYSSQVCDIAKRASQKAQDRKNQPGRTREQAVREFETVQDQLIKELNDTV